MGLSCHVVMGYAMLLPVIVESPYCGCGVHHISTEFLWWRWDYHQWGERKEGLRKQTMTKA